MRWGELIRRSLVHHARTHLGVVLGAVLGAAVLGGALLVGSSVRESLLHMGLKRIGPSYFALDSGDRFFRSEMLTGMEAFHSLSGHVSPESFPEAGRYVLSAAPVTLLRLEASAARQDGSARANQIWVHGSDSGNLFRPAVSSRGDAGVDQSLWDLKVNAPPGGVILNEALARQLGVGVGDDVVLRVRKPSALSRDAVITPRDDQSFALRGKVHAVMTAEEGGDLSLSPSQTPPMNAFVRLDELSSPAGISGRVNMALLPPLVLRPDDAGGAGAGGWKRWMRFWAGLTGRKIWFGQDPQQMAEPVLQQRLYAEALRHLMTETDAELSFRAVPGQTNQFEMISRRIFIDDVVLKALLEPVKGTNGAATAPRGVLTYLVNQLVAGTESVPYSMVSAVGAPWVPADLKPDEMVINEWLARELKVAPGDFVEMSYYLLDTGSRLAEATNRFRVRQVVPMAGIHADRTLMPEFPGLTKAESTRDWDAGFKLVYTIRDQDEAYWKQHRGTPKAYISLSAGQKLWANRFGAYTAMRFEVPAGAGWEESAGKVARHVLSGLDPRAVGLGLVPIREQAEQAASNSQDFGGLFIGFSFFIIISALVLIWMLFQFGLEQRRGEVGLLLAVGYSPRRVRRLFLREGMWVAALGCALGGLLAVQYARGVIRALNTIWKDAVSTSALDYHANPLMWVVGMGIAWVLAMATIAWGLRKLGSYPARALLAGEGALMEEKVAAGTGRAGWAWVGGLAVAALGMGGWGWWKGDSVNPVVFFLSGSLGLVAGLLAVRALLAEGSVKGSGKVDREITLSALARAGVARRRSRSLATVVLLACGTFLVLSIGVNRLDAERGAGLRSSGTGGFAFVARSAIPIVDALDDGEGQERLGLDKGSLAGLSVVPFRVKAGDDASCLNLNRAQRPQILAVSPELLASRKAFSFAGSMKGVDVHKGWELLKQPMSDGAIPVIGDAASIKWAMGKALGDTLVMTDDAGREMKLRLVAGLANSILQGNLVMDEDLFVKRFPSAGGYQWYLLDAPATNAAAIRAELSRGLRNQGFEVTSASQRLADFNAVQNTYLGTFQVLGGLGLILGSVGMGVVLLRNALERRTEFAVLRAVGFPQKRVYGLLWREHFWILMAGLGVGVVAAAIAVLPLWLSPGGTVPWLLLGGMIVGTGCVGLISIGLASRWAMRGVLLESLRGE